MTIPVTAYLSIGSNIGDRVQRLRQACQSLESAGLRLRSVSSIYETEPVDVVEQDWFLNCAACIETTLGPEELLAKVHEIERDLGRVRERPKGPRTVDIDILLYGDSTFRGETLILPHPRMLDRRFVLEPLREIAPDLHVPPDGKTVSELLHQLKDPAQVCRIGSLGLPITT
ncbi:MAG: 2-amino-4-hydroxy-6-hydroxymethyldihydropteridine diphosphokinase [Acidobacteria bacterium]|nr:2-amino-4-hydroxy-6-hydroxymethyldihydropteridine diphosphokinase [Acidobacteriota bacterium]